MSDKSIEELGKLISSQMKKIQKVNTETPLELGVIGSDMSLHVSSLGNTIPKGDYMMSIHLYKDTESQETVELPERLRNLQSGDRVLVAWVGTEPIVVDILISS